jgi:phosphoserine phosphatase RsbU/P
MPNNPDTRAHLRHEARTFLNHAIGYAELLPDARELDADEACARALAMVQTAAQKLRKPILEYLEFLDPSDSALNLARTDGKNAETLKQEAYAHIYDLINAIQGARRACPNNGAPLGAVHTDLRSIHDAINSLVDLLEEREERGAYVPDAAPSANSTALSAPVLKGRILIIDDDQFNRDLLTRHLERQGHVVCQAADGPEAFNILKQAGFDIVLLDVMMPGMNGFQFLEIVRGDKALHELSVIVVSALDDPASMARCLELGAEDYLQRDFNPVILKARINNILEKKEYKLQNQEALRSLAAAQSRLATELKDAAAYVRSLLPKRARWADVAIDWEFIPSLSLGGDSFSYQRLDDGRLAIFLIDVSGHGIEAALLSVTVMNLLKTMALGGVDYGNPGSVLKRLNASFKVEDQNNMYFTIWYGVYDPADHSLVYATGGAPPAVLVKPDEAIEELVADGPIIGVDDEALFAHRSVSVSPGSHLYLFSDGLFEVRTKSGELIEWTAFLELLLAHHRECALAPSCLSPIKRIVDAVLELSAEEYFADDVSILEFAFHD